MARKRPPIVAPKRRESLSYEAIADAYRQELRAMPGGGPFSDYDLVRLRRFFGGRRLAAITDEAVRDYALRREERDGAALETINGELDTLHHIRQFAVRRGLVKGWGVYRRAARGHSEARCARAQDAPHLTSRSRSTGAGGRDDIRFCDMLLWATVQGRRRGE
jgi:hypothetical protein